MLRCLSRSICALRRSRVSSEISSVGSKARPPGVAERRLAAALFSSLRFVSNGGRRRRLSYDRGQKNLTTFASARAPAANKQGKTQPDLGRRGDCTAIYRAYRYLPDHPAPVDPRPRPGQVQQDQSPQWIDLIGNFYEVAGIGAFRVLRRSLEHDAAKNHADTERANRHRSNDERRISDYTLGSKRVPILGTRRHDG